MWPHDIQNVRLRFFPLVSYAEARSPRPDGGDLKPAPRGDGEHPQDPTGTAAEADPEDPKKRCALCAASFNNPLMASQHYNGRKHQRNQARRDLLKELGDDARQGTAGSTASICRGEEGTRVSGTLS